jgi:hydroxymethylbilane synthase
VLTRLRKLITHQEEHHIDGLLLARAGLERLGFDLGITNGQGGFLFEEREFFVMELSSLLPAPGQGAIAVETRIEKNSPEFEEALGKIHHEETARCVAAERLLLYYLGGGCHMALGALATIDPFSQQLYLRASYVPFASAQPREGEATGATPEEVALIVATQLGEKLA